MRRTGADAGPAHTTGAIVATMHGPDFWLVIACSFAVLAALLFWQASRMPSDER